MKIFPFSVFAAFFLGNITNPTFGQNRRQLQQGLDSVFTAMFSQSEPGGSIFIQQHDTVLYASSFGLANLDTGEPFTSGSVCNLGSISKTFVAYAILMLEKEGKLNLDDPIIQYFRGFQHKETVSKVTIRHLLTHTSGLPDSRQTTTDSIFYLTAKDAENFEPILATQQLEFEPGSQWKYSNPAYNGLALIIEKVTGKPWQQYVQQNIIDASGMRRSTITDGLHPEKGVAHGYRYMENRWQEYDYGEYPTFAAAGNGGVWSSIDDLRKYAAAIEHCTFTDCQTIAKAQTTVRPANWSLERDPWHGLAWFVHPSYLYNSGLNDKLRVIEHAGDQGGFRTHLLRIPGVHLTIIWITNNEMILTPAIWNLLKKYDYVW